MEKGYICQVWGTYSRFKGFWCSGTWRRVTGLILSRSIVAASKNTFRAFGKGSIPTLPDVENRRIGDRTSDVKRSGSPLHNDWASLISDNILRAALVRIWSLLVCEICGFTEVLSKRSKTSGMWHRVPSCKGTI